MKRVVISGYYGFANSGDEAILRTIISDLRELEPDISITVLSIDPEATTKQHGVNAVYRYNLLKLLKCIRKCDLLISGGGSLIQDITSTRSLIYYLAIIRIAAALGRKIMLYANGIGPVTENKNRKRARKILDKIDVITLRESDSHRLLEQIGVKKPEITVTADPVLTCNYACEERVKEIFRQEGIPLDRDIVGINLREWKSLGSLEEEITASINYMYEHYNLLPVFIPMAEADKGISQRVISKLDFKAYMLKQLYEPEDLIGIIKNMKIIIAMRLHTLIYASINSIPMIGLVYDPKIKGYMEYIKQTYTGEVDVVKTTDINSRVDSIISNYDTIKSSLNSIIEKLKLQSKRNAKIAVRLLNKNNE